jgi:hypothetical protein
LPLSTVRTGNTPGLRFSVALGEEPEVGVALVARQETRRVALWAYRERPGGLLGRMEEEADPRRWCQPE